MQTLQEGWLHSPSPHFILGAYENRGHIIDGKIHE